MTVQPIAFAILIATVPMPEPPACTRMVSPGLELGVVEQHVLDGGKRDRRAGGVASGCTPFGHRNDQPCRHVHAVAGKAVDVEAHDAGDVFAEIVAPLAAGLQVPQVSAPYITTGSPGLKLGHAVADGGDLAGGFRADHERQLALGEGHAAKAPDVDVVERDRLDRDLHLVVPPAGAGRDVAQFEFAVGNERERADGRGHAGSRPRTSDTFCPPKPNELEMTWRTLASRAALGTTSSGMPGSGT